MKSIVRIYSTNKKELQRFLELFFINGNIFDLSNNYWEKSYENPVEISDIAGVFTENHNHYPNCNMWVSIDNGVFININDDNCTNFIKYLYERFPY